MLRLPFKQKVVWFRIDADFQLHKDLASLYYSLDGKTWEKAISDFKLIYDYRRFFMGTRFGISYYAIKQLGGYVDVDEFIVNE